MTGTAIGTATSVSDRRRRRLRALATPETGLALLIALVWALLASLQLLPIPLVVFIVVLTAGIHLVTVDAGNFSLLWIATGWIVLLIVVSTRSALDDPDPLLFTVAGFTALTYNELIRLAFARRRAAKVDRSVFASSTVGLALVGLVSIVGIGLSAPLVETTGRSWLWMPLAIAVITAIGLAFVIAPTIRAPAAHKDRWQPGDRIPPRREPDAPS